MDVADDPGLRQRQQVVIALEVAAERREALAAVAGFVEPVALDHGAHGAVEDENPRAEQLRQQRQALRAGLGDIGSGGHTL